MMEYMKLVTYYCMQYFTCDVVESLVTSLNAVSGWLQHDF